jgi:cysteinyl-tRNA synthetase
MECSAMSLKYLGERFDIHGGGMDLVFPHHEAEMAQGTVCGCVGARYWMHNNMVTVGGQKMGKSLGNSISLEQMFTGAHPLLEKAYSPMTIRFFMLQAHYRSTLDFSNEALQAAEKGLDRLMKAVETLDKIVGLKPTKKEALPNPSVKTDGNNPSAISPSAVSDGNNPSTILPSALADGQKPAPTPGFSPTGLEAKLAEAMDDDLSSPLVIAALFDAVRIINQINDGAVTITPEDLAALRQTFHRWVFDILGLKDEKAAGTENHLDPVMKMLLELRAEAKAQKNWALSDRIRNGLAAAGIKIMDNKDGTSAWLLQ